MSAFFFFLMKATSKQCPDVCTANFIRKLGKVHKKRLNEKLKVYTLTNLDPHSAIVARNYQLALKTECNVSWLSYKLWKMRGSLKLATQNMVKLSHNERRDAKLNAKRWSKATRTTTALELMPLSETMVEMIRYNEKFSLLALSSSRRIDEEGTTLGLFEYVAKVLPDC